MRLDTERIKAEKIYSNTQSQTVKLSQEYCVLAALRYYFPGEFEKVEHLDHPDLRSDNYGIEVVSVTDGNERKVEALFKEYKVASRNNQDASSIAKRLDKRYRIDNSIRKPILQYPTSTSRKEQCLVQKAISKKKRYISEYKAQFLKVDLAVYFSEIPSSECLENLHEWARCSFSIDEEKYGRIFFISCRNITVVETKNWTSEIVIEIPGDIWRALRIIGRLTAEGVIKPTDDEWN